MDHELFKEIEAEVLQEAAKNPFRDAGLQCDFRKEDPIELTELMVGYNSHLKSLLKLMWGSVGQKESNSTTKVAIVGPQGIGKTSLIQEFVQSVNTTRLKGSSEITKHVNMAMILPLKLAFNGDFDFLGQVFGGEKIERMVLAFDDFQTLIYPNRDARVKTKDSYEDIDKYFDQFQKSLILSTWTSFGWNYALRHYPDFYNYFDEVIFLSGPDDEELETLIDKRLKKFSDSSDTPRTFNSFFSEESRESILLNCSNNPRLLISLIAKCIEKGNPCKGLVSDSIVRQVLTEEGIGRLKLMSDKQLLSNKTFKGLLSHKKVDLLFLEKLIGLDRSTLQRNVTNFENLGLVVREQGSNTKKYLYSIKSILRAKFDLQLMQDLSEATNRII